MAKYINVRFAGSSNSYMYELPSKIKLENIKAGDAVVVPVGDTNTLKLAKVSATTDMGNKKIDPGFPIKKVFGLVKVL